MKKNIITLSLLISSSLLYSQDTLRHFDPQINVPIADTYPSNQGYYTGHNDYGDEEFAEKYEISGNGNVLGMVAIHKGVAGTSTMNASYRIYDTAPNGLPGTQKASKAISNNTIPIDESPFVVLFDNSVSVSGEFFVSFRLGDYSHSNPGTKKIAITHSPNGTRPPSDFSIFGRNAIRWHSHSGTVWKDYRTENFQSYQPAVYFSLFPIVELEPTASVIEFNKQDYMRAVFPNPSLGSFTIPINSTSEGEAVFQLFDSDGKLITERHTQLTSGKNDYLFTSDDLASGTYILLVKIPGGSAAQRIIIN